MRMRLRHVLPVQYEALGAWHTSVQKACADSGLPQRLVDLVWIRVSQLNGCGYCLDMHHREAREHGESQPRLDVLPAWRTAGDLFTLEERAALGLAEAMTLLPARGVPDEVWGFAAEALGEQQIGALIMSVSVINAYNRIGVTTGAKPPRRH